MPEVDQIALECLKTFADFGMKLAATIIVVMGWIISNKDTRLFLRTHKGMALTIGVTTTLAISAHTVGMAYYLHYGFSESSSLRSFYWMANVCHGLINSLLIAGVWMTLHFVRRDKTQPEPTP
jgi:hypothetical protein